MKKEEREWRSILTDYNGTQRTQRSTKVTKLLVTLNLPDQKGRKRMAEYFDGL
jgi:hypothetical protein